MNSGLGTQHGRILQLVFKRRAVFFLILFGKEPQERKV